MGLMNFNEIPQITIASYSVDVPWNYIEKWIDDKEHPYGIEIEPDFQRHHVWNDAQRSKYIEWCLRGGRSGRDIFWNCPGWQRATTKMGPIQLVDGLQRLTSVRMFMRDEVSAFGFKLSEFEGHMRVIHNNLKFHVNDLENKKDVLNWYLDMNDGGVVHTKKELDKVRKMLCEKI